MESLFFGPSSAPLYGVYCPARPDRDRGEGIVFCYPFGQEYMRSHRPIRQLAINLADMGYHVLRFDYRGTGDSAGELEGLEIADWVDDVKLAVEELRDMAATSKVSLIGLRLGSLVATVAACNHGGVANLVLWDPVSDGSEYLQELVSDLQKHDMSEAQANFIDQDEGIHLNGFTMPRKFQQSLGELALSNIDIGPLDSVLQLVSHENPGFSRLKAAWSANDNYTYQLEPAPHDWNYVDNFGSIMLPQPIMTAIKAWFL